MQMNTRSGLGLNLNSPAKFAIGVILTGLLAGCPSTPDKIANLPELPDDLAIGLELAHTAPVLMTKAPAAVITSAPPSENAPLPLAPNKACTAKYDGFAIYPITVCYPPYDLEQLQIASAKQSFAALGFNVKGEVDLAPKYFKLSSHLNQRFRLPWFCAVRGGPWYVHVEGAQMCNTNPNIRQFKAELLGAPEPVVVIWSGAITDVPAPLQLVGITDSGESCTCCSGVMCPDQSCKPKFDQCGVMPPAIK
jgi:hypothetical protein